MAQQTVEQPATSPLAKVRGEKRLDADDWRNFVKYAASLDLRTPASYVEFAQPWAKEVPANLQSSMHNLEGKLRVAMKSGELQELAAHPFDPQGFRSA